MIEIKIRLNSGNACFHLAQLHGDESLKR